MQSSFDVSCGLVSLMHSPAQTEVPGLNQSPPNYQYLHSCPDSESDPHVIDVRGRLRRVIWLHVHGRPRACAAATSP